LFFLLFISAFYFLAKNKQAKATATADGDAGQPRQPFDPAASVGTSKFELCSVQHLTIQGILVTLCSIPTNGKRRPSLLTPASVCLPLPLSFTREEGGSARSGRRDEASGFRRCALPPVERAVRREGIPQLRGGRRVLHASTEEPRRRRSGEESIGAMREEKGGAVQQSRRPARF
jgi:hypothetical protein